MATTLGPCADALGISVMMVFMLGVAQLPIMMALALHYPAVRIDVFNAAPLLAMDPATNETAVVMPAQIDTRQAGYYMHSINISGLFVLCAASFTFFVVLTMHLMDRGRSEGAYDNSSMHNQEYTRQNLAMLSDPSFRTWNQSFIAATLLLHIVIIVTVSSPASMDLILSSSALLYTSLANLVQPLDNYEEEGIGNVTTGAASMAAQSTMMLCMIYCGTILFVMTRLVLYAF